MDKCTSTHTDTDMHTRAHTRTHVCAGTHIHTRGHTQIHTHARVCTHTHTRNERRERQITVFLVKKWQNVQRVDFSARCYHIATKSARVTKLAGSVSNLTRFIALATTCRTDKTCCNKPLSTQTTGKAVTWNQNLLTLPGSWPHCTGYSEAVRAKWTCLEAAVMGAVHCGKLTKCTGTYTTSNITSLLHLLPFASKKKKKKKVCSYRPDPHT